MNIIEKGTRQQMDTQDKIRSKTGNKWTWLIGAALVLIVIISGGLFYSKILTLTFSPYDYLFIGIFIVALAYCLMLLQRLR